MCGKYVRGYGEKVHTGREEKIEWNDSGRMAENMVSDPEMQAGRNRIKPERLAENSMTQNKQTGRPLMEKVGGSRKRKISKNASTSKKKKG